MAEVFTLTTPITPTVPSTTSYELWSLYLGRQEGVVVATLISNTNERITVAWRNSKVDPTEGTNLLIALNKANLSVKSLQKRVLEQAVLDNKLPTGSVTGIVD